MIRSPTKKKRRMRKRFLSKIARLKSFCILSSREGIRV
jgi:hypothetical protein